MKRPVLNEDKRFFIRSGSDLGEFALLHIAWLKLIRAAMREITPIANKVIGLIKQQTRY